MDQAKNLSFDNVVYYNNIASSKVFSVSRLRIIIGLPIFLFIFFSWKTGSLYNGLVSFLIVLPLITIGIIGGLLLAKYSNRSMRKKIALGLNKQGVYSLEYGFFSWDEIKDAQIGYDVGRFFTKTRLILLIPHNIDKVLSRMSFFNRLFLKLNLALGSFSVEKAIPAMYEFYVVEPIEDVLSMVKGYISS